jgi:hypothetical protein
LIVAFLTRRHVVVGAIPSPAAGAMIYRTLPPKSGASTINRSRSDPESILKYVVVFALVGLLLYLLYRKLRPYLIAGRSLFVTIRDLSKRITSQGSPQHQSSKLLQCENCGTWVPGVRMLTGKSGQMVCSKNCLNKSQTR